MKVLASVRVNGSSDHDTQAWRKTVKIPINHGHEGTMAGAEGQRQLLR